MTRPPRTIDEDRKTPIEPGANVILCADDFGMTEGVSRGIEELALARRLSATSALVNLPAWKTLAPRLNELRPYLATGLHLNLTLGPPTGPMPGLAPDGELPEHMALVRKCLTAAVSVDEIAAEIARQLTAFEEGTGFPPDFVDGHQHVHSLPRVRRALLEVLKDRYPGLRPLVRDPEDRPARILRRLAVPHKALAINMLSLGFGGELRGAGFVTNHGFSGVSAFDLDSSYEDELCRFFSHRGPRHLVMCHPGYPDAELAELDPVVERRHQELDAIFAVDRLDEAIWHVPGGRQRAPIDWEKALPA
jgi:hypothetical protein